MATAMDAEALFKIMQTEVAPPSMMKKFEDINRFVQIGDLTAVEETMNSLKEEKIIQAALEARDFDGMTAAHLVAVAAAGGKKEIIKCLLRPFINMRDWEFDETPLHREISKGCFEKVVVLLEYGADPNLGNKKGHTSLHYAVENESKELVELLISKGADINAVADCGTPLQQAAGKDKVGFVKFLLHHNADPNVTSPYQLSPLLASVRAQFVKCTELLLKAGADPNFPDSKGMTPLGYAASEGLGKIVNCLLNSGADPNVADKLGMTPIEAAALKKNRLVVWILFPLTSPIQTIRNWSIPGLFKHVQSLKAMKAREQKLKDLFLILKSKGAGSFNKMDYFGAVHWYTEALFINPADASVLLERSLSWANLSGDGRHAFDDAYACIKLRPNCSKAQHLADAAKTLTLKEFDRGVGEFLLGLAMEFQNKICERRLRKAIEAVDN